MSASDLPPERDGALTLPDGRTLSYATFGADDAPLVVVLDGPGSRGLARAASGAAQALGLRLAAPDRPGWAASTPSPGRRIADWPGDHAALLDHLGAPAAGVLAQSGGTPFALAAAAALPERTTALAFLGALAPLDEPGALDEAGKQLRGGIRLGRRAPWLLRLLLRGAARQAAKDPEKAASRAFDELPPRDAELMAQARWHALHVRASSEILSRPDAFATEIGLLGRAWGIDLGAVRAPAAFWTGAGDRTHPPAHARRVAALLGGAPVTVVEDAWTLGLLDVYPDALRFAAGVLAPTP